MLNILESYLDRLQTADAVVLEFMNDGAGKIDMSEITDDNIVIPQDVLDFWHKTDGLNSDTETTLEKTWLDGTFSYFSHEAAIEDYKICISLWNDDEDFENYWPRGFLPIASPGDGSRLLVNCRSNSPTYAHVYELFHGIGLSLHADTLSAYFKTITALFDTNAIYVKGRVVEIDDNLGKPMAASMNPKCDAYNDDLIPASESRNWLADGEET